MMLMDKEHGRRWSMGEGGAWEKVEHGRRWSGRWSGMFAILITSIVLKATTCCFWVYLLLLGLSDKESATVSAVSLVNISRKQ